MLMVHFSGQKHFVSFGYENLWRVSAGGAQVQAQASNAADFVDVCLRSTLVLVWEYDEGASVIYIYSVLCMASIINVLL